MSKNAFFFKDDVLLVPVDFPDIGIEKGIPLEYAKDFDNLDIFEIPIINNTTPAMHTVSLLPETPIPENWRSIPVRQILASVNTIDGNAILRACHIAQWRQDSHYCGRCGAKNSELLKETQRQCTECGRTEFPRICPAVIVLVTDSENRILLAHNRRFKTRVYSHISGFNEAGETLEETVVREIREEVNIEVKDIEYVKSQPWPFPNSLMVGFKACYSSGTLKPDGVEIQDAGWFTKESLPDIPAEGSLSRFLINSWLAD